MMRTKPMQPRWPSETGVPDNHVAGCPNYPTCHCTESCIDNVQCVRMRLAEWVLVAALAAGTLLGLWLILTGGGNG